ncbi:MAG: hypothetical protein ABI869_05215 [Actinomycetota bacterium]
MVGTVALWGRVVEHALGWRGEFAYPQRLALVCHVCLYQAGVGRSRASVVVVYRGGALVPVCERHLPVTLECGSKISDVWSADGILSEVTEGYAVEAVAVERPSPLLSRAGRHRQQGRTSA